MVVARSAVGVLRRCGAFAGRKAFHEAVSAKNFNLGGPDVFLDSYAAIPRAARCSLIVFQPSALLIFSSRYHTM